MTTLPTTENYTPNNFRRQARTITEIVIHHWGSDGQDFGTVANYLASDNTRNVSIHWVVQGADKDGTPRARVARVVPEADIAFHAGNWDANVRSVGIECRPEAREADYLMVAAKIAEIRSRRGDLPLRPHNRYQNTACPGRYDLARLDQLARNLPTQPTGEISMSDAQTILARIETLMSQEAGRYSDLAGRLANLATQEAGRYSDLAGRIMTAPDADAIAAALEAPVAEAVAAAMATAPTTGTGPTADQVAAAVVDRLAVVLSAPTAPGVTA